MIYVASTKPRNAPNQPSRPVIRAMSRRRSPIAAAASPPIEWPKNLISALSAIEWPDCKCTLSLMSICIIGKEQGCRQRRKNGKCECKVRWLPSCLLKQKHGCNKRRLSQHGRQLIPECLLEHPLGCFAREQIGICECERVPKPSCDCELVEMPCCLAAGCPDRQKGHICDCPRGPSSRCRHMTERHQMVMKAAFFTIQRMFPQYPPYDMWAYLQRERDGNRKPDDRYDDPEPPGAPQDMSTRERAIEVMTLRASCQVGLFHPDDRRAPEGERERRRQLAQVRNYGLLPILTFGKGEEAGYGNVA